DVTGLDESSLVSKVFVYPNPANELLNIAFIGLTAERVELLSVHGQVILSSNQVSDSATLDISKLASGTYFIKVITASGNALKQIIIK
ncbi:MAG: T9SS type A sorting domain-containing protein, partial [Bacteroidota bacterium]